MARPTVDGFMPGMTAVNVRMFKDVDVKGLKKRFADGREEVRGGVVVGADGPHSCVRRAVVPAKELRILPYAVFNGKRKYKASVLQQPFAASIRDQSVVTHVTSEGARFEASVASVDGENVTLSYTFSRRALQDRSDPLFRPERAKAAAKEIPIEFLQELSKLHSSLPTDLQEIFDPESIREDRTLNWLMRSLPVTSEELTTAAQGKIFLIGDSIHAEPILGGEGANQAILDGITLADYLAV